MLGLIVLVAIVVYALISLVAVVSAVKWARNNGRSTKRWGWGVALGMYLLVFWDFLPTVIAHKYYCDTEAGFWVYKTPEQWKAENPLVAETLSPTKNAPSENGAYILNERFRWSVKKTGPHLVNLWRDQQEVFDIETGDVMARYTDFSSGYGNPLVHNSFGLAGLKFWLARPYCSNGELNQGKMYSVVDSFKSIGQTR